MRSIYRLLFAAGFTGILILSVSAQDLPTPTFHPALHVQPIFTFPDPGTAVAWHPDGLRIAVALPANMRRTFPSFGREIQIWSRSAPEQQDWTLTRTVYFPESVPRGRDISHLGWRRPGLGNLFYASDSTLATFYYDEVFEVFTAFSDRFFAVWNTDGRYLAIGNPWVPFGIQIMDDYMSEVLTSFEISALVTERPMATGGIGNVSWSSLLPQRLVFVGPYDRLYLLDAETQTLEDITECCARGTYEVEWQPGGSLMATGSQIYDLDRRQMVFEYPFQSEVHWRPDGQLVAGVLFEDITLISVEDQGILTAFRAAGSDGDSVRTLEWSPDGRYIVTVTYAGEVSIWDVEEILAEVGE